MYNIFVTEIRSEALTEAQRQKSLLCSKGGANPNAVFKKDSAENGFYKSLEHLAYI